MQAARLRVPQQFDLTFVISGFLTSDWNTEKRLTCLLTGRLVPGDVTLTSVFERRCNPPGTAIAQMEQEFWAEEEFPFFMLRRPSHRPLNRCTASAL